MKSRSIKNVPPGSGTHLRCLACGRKFSDEEFGEAGPHGGQCRECRVPSPEEWFDPPAPPTTFH